jgi:hypothetical protein
MRNLFSSTLLLVVIASPAAALLNDEESSNNNIATASIQISMPPNEGAVSIDAGANGQGNRPPAHKSPRKPPCLQT